MKKFFTAIRQGDMLQVKELLEKNPALISCVAKHPPKKDDGQSPLQVAIKSNNLEIANYLIDSGADVNFIEIESCNEWKMPVLQDAIRATIMCSRFLVNSYRNHERVWETRDTKVQFEMAFNILEKMLNLGAEIDCHDSYGNSCLGRAILDAKQILPRRFYQEPERVDERPLNIALTEDLTLVFDLLLKYGANMYEIDKRTGETLFERNKQECVAQFLRKNS